MLSLSEVAREAGVSKTTVSRVLNNKPTAIPISEATRQRILKVAKELNYHANIFARSLRTKRSGFIGAIVSDITDPYFSDIINGIEQILNKVGYYFLLSTAQNSSEKEETYLERLKGSGVDGLLVIGATMQISDRKLKELGKNGVPIVLVGRRVSCNIASVTVDNLLGGLLATEHLIQLGYHNIVHITSKQARLDVRERLDGYEKAMAKHGFKGNCSVVRGNIGIEGGYEITSMILKQVTPPVAIFAFNDAVAIGAIRAIRDFGSLHIPEDIAVVGFDDIPMAAHYEPSLTTVHQPRLEMGKLGAELLIDVIKGEKVKEKNIILKPRLVIRRSSKG